MSRRHEETRDVGVCAGLDLDHVGPGPGEDPPDPGRGEAGPELHDTQARERQRRGGDVARKARVDRVRLRRRARAGPRERVRARRESIGDVEDFALVCARDGHRTADPPGRPRESVRGAGRPQTPTVLEHEGLEESPRGEVLVGEDAGGGVHRGERDVTALAFMVGLGDGELLRQIADEDVEQLAEREPVRGRTAKIGEQDLFVAGPLVDPLRERLPMSRAVHHQIDEAVFAAIGAGRNGSDEPRADALRDDVVLEPFADAGDVRDRGHRLEARDVDVLAPPRAVAMGESDEAAAGGEGRGDDVGLVTGEPDRRIGGIADRDHRGSECARDEVVRAEVALRTRLAEARDRSQDESGIALRELGPAETALGEEADGMTLDHEIGARRERTQSLAIGLAIEVEDDAPLVPVRIRESESVEFAAATQRLAVRRLDLDDVRPEIGKQLSAVGGALRREIEHAEIPERAIVGRRRHFVLISCSSRRHPAAHLLEARRSSVTTSCHLLPPRPLPPARPSPSFLPSFPIVALRSGFPPRGRRRVPAGRHENLSDPRESSRWQDLEMP
jgi:hypothetical protein